MQRSNVWSASERFHVIVFVERCFGIFKLHLLASYDLQKLNFAAALIERKTNLATSNDFKNLPEAAASYPLQHLIGRLVTFYEPWTLWHP